MQTGKQVRRHSQGFSILELVAVLAITMTLGALATPYMVTVTANVRLRSGMNSLSGIMQECRTDAIRDNRMKTTRLTVLSNGPVAYVKDANLTGAAAEIAQRDPQAQLGAPVTHITSLTGVTGAPTALDHAILGFDVQSPDKLVSFNPRGLPCLYSSGACTVTGFVLYFNDTRPLGGSGWGAVTVSPAGRVKVWMWTGSQWGS